MSWDAWMDRYESCAKGVIMFGKDGTEWFRRGCVDCDSSNGKLLEYVKKGQGKDASPPDVNGKKFMFLRNAGSGLMFKKGDDTIVIVEGPGTDAKSRPYVLLSGDIKPEIVLKKVTEQCGCPADMD